MNTRQTDDVDLELVELAYAAAAGETDWTAVMEEVSERFRLAYCLVSTPSNGPTMLNAGVHSASREAVAEVLDYWCKRDTRTPRYVRRAIAHQGDWVSDAQIYEETEIQRSALHQDYFRPRGADNFLGLSLRLGETDYFFTGGLPLGRRPRDLADSPGLKQTVRHLVRAADLWLTRNRSQKLQEIASTGAGRPVIEITQAGRWKWLCSDAAPSPLSGVVTISHGKPVFHTPAIRNRFEQALNPAAPIEPQTIPIECHTQGVLTLCVHRVPHDPFSAFTSGDMAFVITLRDARAPGRLPEEVLQLLGLTPAEARLAACVGSALAPSQAAARLGISVTTARSTLATVYAKLDISRQAELVRMVTLLTH